MPRTSEPAINAVLGQVLRRKHPLWRTRVHTERTGVFQEAALRPDIVVDHPGGLPVVVETEIEPASEVEDDVLARIGKPLQVLPGTAEQVVAVRMPLDLAAAEGDLERRIEAVEFAYCVHTQTRNGTVRWPSRGWLAGSASDLADCIERVSVAESLLLRGTLILERAVEQTAALFAQRLRPTTGRDPVAVLLHQESGEQTDRMAMAILANAVIFHNVIAAPHELPKVRELSGVAGSIIPGKVEPVWRHVLVSINYWPIFDIALGILRRIDDTLASRILTALSNTADELAGIGVTNLHDMSGRMFQTLIADRKFLATFYTLPVSAALLADLAIPDLDVDWSERRSIEGLRIADLACGTGILLSAAYQSILTRHRRTGGDDQRLHRPMMERSLIAADIMPAATHLAASMLSSAHPGTTFGNTCVYTMPYGNRMGPGRAGVSVGALDLLGSGLTGHLFGTGAKAVRGKGGAVEEAAARNEFTVADESIDLVIMNPPFTRPTNHESTIVPIPSFAGFEKSRDEQKAMSRALKRLRGRMEDPVGHGNAGLASSFVDLAHRKVKPGGTVAFVLPAAAVTGESWSGMRRLLASCYRDIVIVTLALSGSTARAFSADTGMAEALLVAKRTFDGEQGEGTALFANLHRRPSSLLESSEIARSIRAAGATSSGKLRVGDKLVVGNFVRAPLEQGGCAGLREEEVARTMLSLQDGMLNLPRMRPGRVPVTVLGTLGDRGLVHRDINGEDGRGAFDILPLDARSADVAAYPALWSHAADRERCLLVQADSEGRVRDGRHDDAIKTWSRTASRLHFNLDFRLNSQSLAACLTDELTIGGTAWPNFRVTESRWEQPLALVANTTLGLMAFWWIGSRQQQGRARLTISRLPDLLVLDVSSLNAIQMARAEAIAEDFRERKFLPANEAYRDETRMALDRAVLCDLFGAPPPEILEPLAVLRRQWCYEPTVHGGKATRIDAG